MTAGDQDLAFTASSTGHPVALMLSDHPAADILCEELHRCGAQSVRMAALADRDTIDFGACDCLVIDVRLAGNRDLDGLAAWVETIPPGLSWAVISDPAGIDGSFALIGDSGAPILLDDDMIGRIVGLARLFGTMSAVAESGADEERERLRRAAEEVAMMARRLAAIHGFAGGGYARAGFGDTGIGYSAEPSPLGHGDGRPSLTARELRKAIAMRRLRNRFFDEALFADPAWDILLDLAAARIEGGQVAVSSLCIAAAVPATTALRWISAMTDQGLLERQDDMRDRRRVNVALSDRAFAAMQDYFAAVRAQGGLPS